MVVRPKVCIYSCIKTMIKRILYVSVFSFLACTATAQAQDSIPRMMLKSADQPSAIVSPVQKAKPIETDNDYLQDTLRLQYEISLLQRMIQRQSSIARLENNFAELGLGFEQPAPPFGVCEQLPVNIPCYRSYPELYDIALPVMDDAELDIVEPLHVEMLQEVKADLAPPPPVKASGRFNGLKSFVAGGLVAL